MSGNPELIATQAQLSDVLTALHASLGTATSAEAVNRVLIEIGEVTHRLNVLSQLIFQQRTDEITAAAQAVAAVTGEVKAAIAEIDKLNAFLTTMTSFLGLVDKVIDLAKTV